MSPSLVGRYVMVWLDPALHGGVVGHYGGVVRRVRLSKRGVLLGLTFQQPGGPRMLTGTTESARCRGTRVTLRREELHRARVLVRGKPGPPLAEAPPRRGA